MKKLLFVLFLFVNLSQNFGSVLVEEVDEEHLHHDNFDILIEATGSQRNDSLTLEAFQQVLDGLNETCLNASRVFDILSVEDGLDEDQFRDAAVLLAYQLSRSPSAQCTVQEISLESARQNLFRSENVCREDIAEFIENAILNGRFFPNEESSECFGSASLVPECIGTSADELGELSSDLIFSMFRRLCFLPEPIFFQEEVLEYLNDQSGYVTLENFQKLLSKFNIGEVAGDEDDHGHEEDDHDDDENERRAKRSLDDDEDEEEEEHHDEMSRCYSASQMLTIAGQNVVGNNTVVLTRQGLLDICPIILQQVIFGSCEGHDEHEEGDRVTDASYTQAKKYGYGTAAVLIISLLAFGGLLLFPSIGTVSYKMTMQFFIALGVGTLSGDALLHLIPEVVGLHGHEAGEDAHAHEEEEEDQTYLFKLLVVIAGIYFFYLFENVLRLYNQVKQGKNALSLHAHHHETRKHSHSAPGKDAMGNHMMTRTSISIAVNNAANGTNNFHEENGESKASVNRDVETNHPEAVCCGITPIGVMVFIGDALHNFGDGLALGVAFSSSFVAGLGASIAIFCHELPHEFGDFAIYLKNGMSKWQGLGMNFLAACCAFIGLYIGLSVSENVEARQWMLAVIAGMFLYIALVDVLHEMIEEVSEDHPYLMFFLQNIGLVLGWVILLLLALYEESIANLTG